MLISLAVVLSFVVYAMTEARESPWKGMIASSGREAQAIAIAVREFEKHQGTKTAKGEPVYEDLRHYKVELHPMGDTLEVGFVPRSGPKDIGGRACGGGRAYEIDTHKVLYVKR